MKSAFVFFLGSLFCWCWVSGAANSGGTSSDLDGLVREFEMKLPIILAETRPRECVATEEKSADRYLYYALVDHGRSAEITRFKNGEQLGDSVTIPPTHLVLMGYKYEGKEPGGSNIKAVVFVDSAFQDFRVEEKKYGVNAHGYCNHFGTTMIESVVRALEESYSCTLQIRKEVFFGLASDELHVIASLQFSRDESGNWNPIHLVKEGESFFGIVDIRDGELFLQFGRTGESTGLYMTFPMGIKSASIENEFEGDDGTVELTCNRALAFDSTASLIDRLNEESSKDTRDRMEELQKRLARSVAFEEEQMRIQTYELLNSVFDR